MFGNEPDNAKAIKEMKATIEALKKEIKELQQELIDLRINILQR